MSTSNTTALSPRGMPRRRRDSTMPDSTSVISNASTIGTSSSRPMRSAATAMHIVRIHSARLT